MSKMSPQTYDTVIIGMGMAGLTAAVFTAIGTATALFFAQSLALATDGNGFIIVDRESRTDVKGVYAAGGCTGGYEQIAKSAGEGCNAAISVIRELKGLTRYADQT